MMDDDLIMTPALGGSIVIFGYLQVIGSSEFHYGTEPLLCSMFSNS